MKKLIVLLGIFCSGFSFSQSFVFEHISSNDGLSNNLVRDIIQDQEGYLWFATSGGLNRFDGHSFDVYKRSVGDTTSLSYSRMKSIFQDENGFIWAISSLGNIHRINPLKRRVDNFQEYKILPEGTSVHSYHISKNGDIWLLLNRGMLRVTYPDKSATKFQATYFDHKDGLPGDVVDFVFDGPENNVWIGTDKGLARMTMEGNDKNKVNIKSFFADEKLSFTSVNCLDNKIYFGTGSHLLIVYDAQLGQFYTDKGISEKLHGEISCITFNHKKEMALGTHDGEVMYVNMKTGKNQYFPRNSFPQFDAQVIGEIHADSFGLFWLVTEKRGVYQFDPGKQKITYFDLNAENRNFLGEGDRQSILEDSNKNLWVGIYGGGLFLFQRDINQFKQFRHDPNNSNSISSDVVLSLYEDRSKNLWIGTSYGGINKISLKKEKLRRITPVKNPKTGFDNYIRSVGVDAMGNIWVGSKAGKIYEYRNNKIIGTLPDDLSHSKRFPVTNVYCLYFDHDNNLWVGTKGNGLFVLKSILKYGDDLGNKNIQVLHFKNEAGKANSLSSDNVYSIRQDIHGQYWIGAFQGGLNLLTDPFGHPQFKSFSEEMKGAKGIVSDEVRYLFFDHSNNLWIGTSEGVSILENKYLNTQERSFINLTPSIKDINSMSGKVVYQIKETQNNDIYLAMLDGGINQLKASDFTQRHFKWIHHNSQVLSPNVYSIEEDNSGNLWMGTDNGLYRMNISDGVVERYRIKNSFLPLTFSESCSQKTLQNELIFGSNNGFVIFHPDSIQKDTTQFPLKFSALEVNGERITNLNSDILSSSIDAQSHINLNYSQNNIALHFAVLDYDKPDAIQYSYFLDGYDTYWSKPSTTNIASYRKLPPGEYVLHVKGTNSSGAWIKKQAVMYIEINPPFWKSNLGYFLITLLVLLLIATAIIIVRRQIVIKNKIRVEKAINEKRIEYYTNISHEFKTPLSLILSPVEELIQSHKSSDFAKQKGMQIRRNATYLKRLIDQILDFRKIREGKMQLKVSEVNLIEFFREIYMVFLPLSNKMGILFDYDYNVDKGEGYADIRQLEKIIYNLISNAFRHTPVGKEVRLVVNFSAADQMVEIRVEDEGEGIDEQELPKIFERFYNSKSSTGIGLFFTREMVNLHHGEIDVYNNEKGGASFRIQIPISKAAYAEDEIDDISQPQIAFNLKSIDDIEAIVSNRITSDSVHRHVVDYIETVLVIEDNDEMRNYLSSELSKKYKVVEAGDGERGIELAKIHQPDLILSDVIMPKVNGYELSQTLKENFDTSHIPIILLTGESTDEKRIMGVKSGADDFIVKPFNKDYLLAKIEKTITSRKKLRKRFERDVVNQIKQNGNESSRESEFMSKVQELISLNLSNPDLNVEFLVEKMAYSRTLFFKRMKAASGYAPNEYLRITKMKEAARMLTTTDKSISEISYAVGFTDSNYFSKTFKKHFGETPSVYKHANTKKSLI